MPRMSLSVEGGVREGNRDGVVAVLHSYGLYSYGLYSYGLYSYGLYSYGLYSYGLYSYGLECGGRGYGKGTGMGSSFSCGCTMRSANWNAAAMTGSVDLSPDASSAVAAEWADILRHCGSFSPVISPAAIIAFCSAIFIAWWALAPLHSRLTCVVMAYIAMAYTAMAYIVMAYTVMAYIAMAYIDMACIAMAYIATAYIDMACIAMPI